MLTHASIVPLIGGPTLAMERVLQRKPEYILSYSPFSANDSQLLNHYQSEVPYYLIDQGGVPSDLKRVDVVTALCPCAGLSSLSPTSSASNSTNDWMVNTTSYVLSHMRPRCFWGENAPRLASKMGEPVRARLYEIARAEGYSLQLFRTRSILHGLSQVRDRSFYFFWQNGNPPLIDLRPTMIYQRIEDTILSTPQRSDDPMTVLVRADRPSDDPFYRYVLELTGYDHSQFQSNIPLTTNPLVWIEDREISYLDVAKWMRDRQFDRQAAQCDRFHTKLSAGGNIMRRSVEIPKDYIGAFVGHMPTNLTHPIEDRYLTIRECMHIMRMPDDFVLIGGVKNLNMLCQNVPVSTAMDMARFIRESLEFDRYDRAPSDYIIQNMSSPGLYEDHAPAFTLEDFLCTSVHN